MFPTFMISPRSWALVAPAGRVSALALSAALAPAAAAQIPAARVFHACYDRAWTRTTPTTYYGPVYRIKEWGLTSACLEDGDIEFRWTDGALDGRYPVTNGFAVTGTIGTGKIPATGVGVRLMWYPGKAAFRAGQVLGAEWDDVNVGPFSTALGFETTASGFASTALG